MKTATVTNEVRWILPELESMRVHALESLSARDVFVRVGMLTRNLHDTLRELGYDKGVEAAVGSLPDARERLNYIAKLTGKAADRVLDAAERAKAVQAKATANALALEEKWAAQLCGKPEADYVQTLRACRDLGAETREHLVASRAQIAQVDDELTEVILAQDFHDLTGQVIQRVTRLAQSLEEQLVRLLIDASQPAQRTEVLENNLAGPVISSTGRDDVVTNQGQVDDLLESLGF